MHLSILLFITFLAFFSLTLAQDKNCCMDYVDRVRPSVKKRLIGYRKQELDERCNIPAVVFTLENGLVFCTDPRERCVHDLMRSMDRLTEESSVRRRVRRFRSRPKILMQQQHKTSKQSNIQKRCPSLNKQKPQIEPPQLYKIPEVPPFMTKSPPRKSRLWPKKRL